MIADISLNGFGAFVIVAVTVITIGLGATGILMQRRSSAIINAMRAEKELDDRDRKRDRETIERQGIKIEALQTENAHLTQELDSVRQLVTQAAKVDQLRDEVQAGFAQVLERLPAA